MAKLKLKKPPASANKDNISRVIQQVYDDINDLVNGVNNEFSDFDDSRGMVGNIRIKKIDNKQYRLEAKTSDGWASIGLTLLEE